MQRWIVVLLCLVGATARANVGISAIKLIVTDRGSGVAKTVFLTKDAAIDKGAGTDPGSIGATLDVHYDNVVDPPIEGRFAAPPGSSYWRFNAPDIAKYVNTEAPVGGAVKSLVIVPGVRAKLTAPSLGDEPLALRSQAGWPTGIATTIFCVDDDGYSECFCSSFADCAWRWTGSGTGTKLVCRNGVPNPTCTAAPQPRGVLTFVTTRGSGTCGSVRSGGAGGVVRKYLTCGGINLGGGRSVTPEALIPAGGQTKFNASCDERTCTITARTATQTGTNHTCSDTGCAFGAYLPISSAGYSWCVRNTFSAPASGTLDRSLGSFDGGLPLSSLVYFTANAALPCPPCIGGTPGVTGSGVCDPAWIAGEGRSPDAGDRCTPVNVVGDTHDCAPPTASALPAYPLDLGTVTTGTASVSNPGGLFCPGQASSGAFGCSGGTGPANPLCPGGGAAPLVDHVAEHGMAAGALTPGPHATILAATFCVPSVEGTLGFVIDSAVNLPGPGAANIPGTFTLVP